MKALAWVNWSEAAVEAVLEDIQRADAFERFKKIVSKSKFTEKDAEALSDKVKESMHKRLKAEGLVYGGCA